MSTSEPTPAIVSGFYFHVHHASNCPVEYCYDYAERARVIETQKPEAERPTRLSRFQRVVWPDTPLDVVRALATLKKARAAWDKAGAALDKARAALDKAGAAWDKARAALDKARAALDKAGAAWDKAGAALDKAGAALDKAGAALEKLLLAHTSEILALHAAQCPGCPWSADKDIFGNKG